MLKKIAVKLLAMDVPMAVHIPVPTFNSLNEYGSPCDIDSWNLVHTKPTVQLLKVGWY